MIVKFKMPVNLRVRSSLERQLFPCELRIGAKIERGCPR